ncbi:MAG: hypothetical protein R3E79_46375 [Caldilineaceae bacterium]
MIPLVELPKIVEHYTPYYTQVFSAEALIEFQRYISGLLVCENKTVEGINRMCMFENRNQSSLSLAQWPARSPLSELEQALCHDEQCGRDVVEAQRRLEHRRQLLPHEGKHFDEIAYLFDSTQWPLHLGT